MAPDQCYCLSCGRRRGEPRLPFMDAVVFMESMRRPTAGDAAPAPEPPADHRHRLSPNSALVTGVATLILAMGVGVMIGRSGEGGPSTAAAPVPQVIRVGGSETETASNSASPQKNAGASKGKSNPKAKARAKANAETGSSGTTKAAEEVLKPAGDVKLPPPTTQVGEKCEKGTAGCSESGEFDGSFFGEE
jgi:hypothetical protein